MSDTVLRVENLGKKYILRHQQGERYTALRDVLAGSVRSFGRRLRPGHRQAANPTREEFWALKDVSFEVRRGDVVGIIGRNGAGKSTLLKILSRITPPTTGRIAGKGRVASLLEVGTGFHPELTGRENIYLNGAILGMSRVDIKRKFDEIVDFAEIEKFLDTPVKRYSSGMYIRLAFAVAAHLEPEILVVDEVLAVGDAAFQKKCLGKMSDVATKEGRTVLFVSHNMAAVKSLCKIGILLHLGRLQQLGPVSNVIQRYFSNDEVSIAIIPISKQVHTPCDPTYMWFKDITLVNSSSGQFIVHWREKIKLKVTYEVVQSVKNVVFGFALNTLEGTQLLSMHHTDNGVDPCSFEPGLYEIEFELDNPLREGTYCIDIGAHDAVAGNLLVHLAKAAIIEVLNVSTDDRIHPKHGTAVINCAGSWCTPHRIA